MIIIQRANSNPYSFISGNSGKVLGKSLPSFKTQEENDICICDFIKCEYVEKVFCDSLNPNDYWKNDQNEFLFRRLINTDSVFLELHKEGVKVDDLDNDNYGTFFDGFPNGTDEQKLYIGYLIDWQKVYNVFGVGKYKIVANLTIIGNLTTTEPRDFNLNIYSDIAAADTVRIESYQNGNILGNDFDFTGLNWYQSLRIGGEFGDPKPVFETTEYVTSQHIRRQNKATMGREWSLNTKLINWEVAEKLVYNKLLGNEILITDYKVKAEALWRRVKVFMKDIEKPQIVNNPNRRYNINFVDEKQIFTKRNF